MRGLEAVERGRVGIGGKVKRRWRVVIQRKVDMGRGSEAAGRAAAGLARLLRKLFHNKALYSTRLDFILRTHLKVLNLFLL